MSFDYTKTSNHPIDIIEKKLVDQITKAGFRLLHTHNVQQTFKEKGVDYIPYRILEICNVKFAKIALDTDKLAGLMMPCPIALWEEKGKTYISTMKPSVMKEFFPDKSFEKLSAELEQIITQIIDQTV